MPSPDPAARLGAAAVALADVDQAVERDDLAAALAAQDRVEEALRGLPSPLGAGDLPAARALAASTARAAARVEALLALAREQGRASNETRLALRAARPAPDPGGLDLRA